MMMEFPPYVVIQSAIFLLFAYYKSILISFILFTRYCKLYSGRKVVSSCWDATVKLWSVNASTGLLEGAPDVELFDHDTPVQCIAVDSTCRYVVAGAEDGNVIVWGISATSSIPSGKSSAAGAPSHVILFKRQVAPSAR